MNGGSLMRATRKPLMKPISAPVGEAAEDRDRRRDAVAEGELAHHHRREHHDRADREVDAGGQDDERLRGADDADDRDLLQDQRQGEGGEELAAEQHAEEDQRQHQHDQRHEGRVAVQDMLDALDRRPVVVLERGDLGRALPRAPSRIPGIGVLASAIGSTPRLLRGPLRGRSARAARQRAAPRVSVREAGQPQHFSMPSAVVIEDTPSAGLSVISVDAGVGEVLAFGLGRQLAGVGDTS